MNGIVRPNRVSATEASGWDLRGRVDVLEPAVNAALGNEQITRQRVDVLEKATSEALHALEARIAELEARKRRKSTVGR